MWEAVWTVLERAGLLRSRGEEVEVVVPSEWIRLAQVGVVARVLKSFTLSSRLNSKATVMIWRLIKSVSRVNNVEILLMSLEQ